MNWRQRIAIASVLLIWVNPNYAQQGGSSSSGSYKVRTGRPNYHLANPNYNSSIPYPNPYQYPNANPHAWNSPYDPYQPNYNPYNPSPSINYGNPKAGNRPRVQPNSSRTSPSPFPPYYQPYPDPYWTYRNPYGPLPPGPWPPVSSPYSPWTPTFPGGFNPAGGYGAFGGLQGGAFGIPRGGF